MTFDNLGGSLNVAGVTPAIKYPGAVSIPGIGSDDTVKQRVSNLTGVDGLFQVGDDENASTLSVGLVSLSTSIPSGPFAKAQFDCTDGQTIQTSQFTCTPDVADVDGGQVPATCALSLSAPCAPFAHRPQDRTSNEKLPSSRRTGASVVPESCRHAPRASRRARVHRRFTPCPAPRHRASLSHCASPIRSLHGFGPTVKGRRT